MSTTTDEAPTPLWIQILLLLCGAVPFAIVVWTAMWSHSFTGADAPTSSPSTATAWLCIALAVVLVIGWPIVLLIVLRREGK